MASRDTEPHLGWRLRDVSGLVVLAVWAVLHLATLWRSELLVPGAIDQAVLLVLGWWPVRAIAEAVGRRG